MATLAGASAGLSAVGASAVGELDDLLAGAGGDEVSGEEEEEEGDEVVEDDESGEDELSSSEAGLSAEGALLLLDDFGAGEDLGEAAGAWLDLGGGVDLWEGAGAEDDFLGAGAGDFDGEGAPADTRPASATNSRARITN